MTTATLARPATAVHWEGLAGTGRLTRFMLRRDRIRLPAWVLGIGLSVIVTAASFPGLYTDAAARQARATIMQSPAAVALGGPKVGVSDYTFGAMLTNELLGMSAVVVGLMAIFTVVRHTRADEELGRTETVLSTPIGRQAPLAAALLMTVIANAALFLLLAVGLPVLGLDDVTWSGSVLFAAAMVSVGVVFGAVAAVTAQISPHARTASGLAGLALGVAYGLRAVGDVSDSFLSWLSPIGWAQRTYAYVDDRWWPLALSVLLTGLLLVLAVALARHRDLGAGLRDPRPGPAVAGRTLSTPLGLATRLERVSVVAWTLSLLVFGLVYGSLFSEVEDFAGDLGTVNDVLSGYGGDLLDAFMSLIVVLLSMTTSIFCVVAVLRARSEEQASRAEAVLATPVSRARWLNGHATVAVAGGLLVLLAGTVGVGLSGATAVGQLSVLTKLLSGAAVQVAPLLLVVAVTVALYGLAPRLTGLVWVVVGYALFVGTFGGLLQLPAWLLNLSPYGLVPQLPGETFTPWPVLGMLLVAAVLYVAGLAGLRRRDMTSG